LLEQKVVHGGVACSQERFGIASAILKLQPDQRWTGCCSKRPGDVTDVLARQSQRGRHTRAESEELPPADASLHETVLKAQIVIRHFRLPIAPPRVSFACYFSANRPK
jgi:hypothetical protein